MHLRLQLISTYLSLKRIHLSLSGQPSLMKPSKLPLMGCDYSPHRATPDLTGPHRSRTGPEMTDYFTSTTVTSRIKA